MTTATPAVATTCTLPLSVLNVVTCPLEVVKDLFESVVSPMLTAPTPLAKRLKDELLRKHFMMIVSHYLAQFAVVSPEQLYDILIESLKYCSIISPSS